MQMRLLTSTSLKLLGMIFFSFSTRRVFESPTTKVNPVNLSTSYVMLVTMKDFAQDFAQIKKQVSSETRGI